MGELRKKFDSLDKNGDGFLTVNELDAMLAIFGEDEAKVKQIIQKWDKEGDGKLSFDEFLDMASSAKTDIQEDESLKKVFEVFNKSGDGFITKKELKEGLSLLDRVSDIDVNRMMEEADLNRDGRID